MANEANSELEQVAGAKVGDPISMQVVQSPSRTTFFPEQFVIAVSPGHVQVAMLRFELIPVLQQGVIVRTDPSGMDVEVKSSKMNGQLTDIAHVRMTTDGAKDLVKLIVEHLAKSDQLDVEEFTAELTKTAARAK